MNTLHPLFWISAVFLFFILLVLWRRRQQTAELLATVEQITLPDFPASQLGNQRPIYVFLPPGYRHSTNHYQVLYLNDGQDAAQLQLHHTLAKLFARRKIQPIVVVAIPTNENRLQEYGTAVCPNARGLGSQATQYTHFLLHELMPTIEREFRVLRGGENTAVLGISLGGLSAFDIAWNHPNQFHTVGVFSGSFWWRSASDETRFSPDTLIMREQVRQGVYRPGFRAWFEAATQDETGDRDNNGVIDAIQDTQELIEELETLGYQDVVYWEVAGGRHDYDTWVNVLPHFLQWAFPREN